MNLSYTPEPETLKTKIIIERGAARELKRYIEPKGARRAAVVTDKNVYALYAPEITAALEETGLETHIYAFEPGEASKTIQTVADIYDFFSASGITRTDIAIALGGGVPGDAAGFAAATYLRGVRLIQMPTTLLACTDSSIGGKTGVDLSSGKNRAGAFYNPELVIVDPCFISTLPPREYSCGMAEVIKYGCIKSPELIELLNGAQPDMTRAIEISCGIKCKLVESDPFDRGERKLLNFGHTLGHAYEKRLGYACSHGQAVAWGMCALLGLSSRLCGLSADEGRKIVWTLEKYGLSTQPPIPAKEAAQEAVYDKKMEFGLINLVLLESIGKGRIVKMTVPELIESLD